MRLAVTLLAIACALACTASANQINLSKGNYVRTTAELVLRDLPTGDLTLLHSDASDEDRSVGFVLLTATGPQVTVVFEFGDGLYDNSWALHTVEVTYKNGDGDPVRLYGLYDAGKSDSSGASIIGAANSRPYVCDGQKITLDLFPKVDGHKKTLDSKAVGTLHLSSSRFYGSWDVPSVDHPVCNIPDDASGNPCNIASLGPGEITACPIGSTSTSGTSSGSVSPNDPNPRKKSGSAFVGLLILFFFGFSLYCCIGIGYKKFVVKAEGTDVLPNASFWLACASSCGSLGDRLRNGCRRTPAGYSAASTEPPAYDF